MTRVFAESTGTDGEVATPAQIGALLVALRMKGETVSELVGAARAMRERVRPRPGALSERAAAEEDAPLVDTCGTGGDGAGSVNVSTMAALVVAACGVRVAKHGNRAVSSRAGSADLLEALGVDVTAPDEVVERCLREVGLGFYFAPAWHGATRSVGPVRRELGVRTLFNLLGPLTNPAGARHQLVGVYDEALVGPLCEALSALGAKRAMVVHGAGGIDELSPAGETRVAELGEGGAVRRYRVTPRDFGLDERDPAGLAGGDAAYNAAVARAVLGGEEGAPRTAVVMAAAATLHVATGCGFSAGARRAEAAIDGGEARRVLERLAALSRTGSPA